MNGPQGQVHLSPVPGHAGGTAFNAIAEELKSWTTSVAHVLPVSDNGGSTSEIVRVIGTPLKPEHAGVAAS